MDEEIKETSKKISRKKIREEQEKKQRHFADKLKTYEDKRAHTNRSKKPSATLKRPRRKRPRPKRQEKSFRTL